MPLISVIVPNYNHAAYLTQRIDSIIHQTYPHFEIILLDDCSADNSWQAIETYRGHDKVSHIIYNEKNSGSPFGLWQRGIDIAKGEWIWIAESDDIAEPNFLEEAVQAIDQFPLLGIFYCDSFIIDENGKKNLKKLSDKKNKMFDTLKWNTSYYNKGIDEMNEYLKFDCTVNNMSSVVLKKSLIENETRKINEFYFHGDWFFILKASFSGNIYYCNRPLNQYRIHKGSHSNSQTLLISSYESFRILSLLYYAENIIEKNKLLDYFVYNCLEFGLIKDGPKKAWRIIQSYFKVDKLLAFKVLKKLLGKKLSRKKQAFSYLQKDTIKAS